MKLSVFSVCMPEYGIHETVRKLKELGYDGVEWRVTSPAPSQKPDNYTMEGRYWTYNLSTVDVGKIEEDAEEIKRICSEAGLEISSLTTYLFIWDADNIERVMKAAKIMGCRNIRVLAPYYDKNENYRTQFDRAATQVKVIEKLAERYDVRVNFEIHMNYIIPSVSAAYRLVAGTDPRYIGIIFDPGNMVHEGFEDYKLGIELLGEYLAHVHIKNGMWVKVGTSEDGVDAWKPVWVPLKKGFVDFKNLIKQLKNVNYTGYLSIEDFSNEEDTYSKLKESLEYLRKLI